jgi:hypothetical protein
MAVLLKYCFRGDKELIWKGMIFLRSLAGMEKKERNEVVVVVHTFYTSVG